MKVGKIYGSRGFEGPWHGVDAGPSRSPGGSRRLGQGPGHEGGVEINPRNKAQASGNTPGLPKQRSGAGGAPGGSVDTWNSLFP